MLGRSDAGKVILHVGLDSSDSMEFVVAHRRTNQIESLAPPLYPNNINNSPLV